MILPAPSWVSYQPQAFIAKNKVHWIQTTSKSNSCTTAAQIENKIKSKNGYFIFGISNRIEQVIANLLDNSISFSQDNQKIEIGLEETSSNLLLSVKDEGPGFAETSPQKIFKRFYSNRPTSFGKHSGLGLNIVKNLVELHNGQISAINNKSKGAKIKIIFPEA